MNCDFSGCNKLKACGYYCKNHHRLICIAGFRYGEVRSIEEEAKRFSNIFGIVYDSTFEKFTDLFVENRSS